MTLTTDLAQFTGTENYYKHPFGPMLYTDGVQYLAQTVGAYWLLDLLATEVATLQSAEPFIAITLTVTGKKGVLTATDGDKGDGPVRLYSAPFYYTDFPEGEWKFFLTGGVLMLPSEY